MSILSELTPSQGVEKALTILLEKGWDSEYYDNWQSYAGEEWGEEDEDYYLVNRAGAWEALLNYVSVTTWFHSDGLSAKVIGTQDDGPAHDSEVYFVVMALTDGETMRYFKRDGWYASYDGGHLEEGEDLEVLPSTKLVTVFNTI